MSASDQSQSRSVTVRRRVQPSLANMIHHRPTPTRSPCDIPRMVKTCCAEKGGNVQSGTACAVTSWSDSESDSDMPIWCIFCLMANDAEEPINTATSGMCADELLCSEDFSFMSDLQRREDVIAHDESAHFVQTELSSADDRTDAKRCHDLLHGPRHCAATASEADIRELPYGSDARHFPLTSYNCDVSFVPRLRRKAFVPQQRPQGASDVL